MPENNATSLADRFAQAAAAQEAVAQASRQAAADAKATAPAPPVPGAQEKPQEATDAAK